jgi:peptidoglycan/xylan/chitin deacetylase (PgdA/CDA1 family)
MNMEVDMERDFIGYADTPPRVYWPNGARLAVSVVVNYEEGGEYMLQDGPRRETMGEVPSPVPDHLRDLYNESFFEYGSRVGVWRFLRLLEKYEVPATFFACARAMERNPRAARAIVEAGHEICGHGFGWEEYHASSREEERENIRRTVESLERTTGQRPVGWFTRYACSPNTRELLVEQGGFIYDSLAMNDDLPYYVCVKAKPWLVLPYPYEANDARFWRGGLTSISGFEEYMRCAFDCLYAEGATTPKMMSVGLHCRIGGSAGRSRAVAKFLAYARSHPGVWFARRMDIARHWLEHQAPNGRISGSV